MMSEEDDDTLVRVPDEGGRPDEEADGQISLPPPPNDDDDDDEDDRAPRMVWDAEPENEVKAEAPRQTESMARRAMRKVGKRLTGKKSTRKLSAAQDGQADRGSSLSRFFGMGGGSSDNGSNPERRGSSLARMMGGTDGEDLRGSSVGRLVFSEGKDGKMKAFRNLRKITSRARKSITGVSSSEAAEALEEARQFQKKMARQESGLSDDGDDGNDNDQSNIAPEDRLMAAVGARRREWQMVYSHLYMKGLGMGGLVDKLLRCGITLADYYSLAVEDEDLDSQAMGFEDFDSMVEQEAMFAEMGLEDGEDATPVKKETASLENMAAQSKKKSSLDEDLAVDTGCSMQEARRLRHAILAFYKCEKALGYLKGHGFDGVLERILKLGLLPDDVREECMEDDPSLLETLRTSCGLSDSVITALGKALLHYDKVQAALNEFDSLSMSEEASFQMNLGLPMGLRLDDDTLVVLAVEPGSQADEAKVPVGCRVLAVGGETVNVVEDAIAAIKRLRDAGNFEATVVYREFVIDEEVQEEKATEKAVEEKSTNKEIVEEESSKKTSPKKDEGGEEEGNKEEEVSNDPLIADKSKEDMEEEEEQCELPGMNNSNNGEEEASNGEGVISEEEVVSPKKSKDRRGSWNMTQTILQDKRANATANLMSQEEFDELVISVRDEEENDMRISMVAESVGDLDDNEDVNSSHGVLKANVGLKLLNSKQIVELCECTPSVKTKHAFLEVLIPRCIDPSEGGASIVEMFRFTEDKERTSDALKIRASALKAGMQMVASTGGSFASGSSSGASAAAVSIAGVTYSAATNGGGQGAKRRGSLGGGVGGSVSHAALKRDATGMIANPLLRKPTAASRGI